MDGEASRRALSWSQECGKKGGVYNDIYVNYHNRPIHTNLDLDMYCDRTLYFIKETFHTPGEKKSVLW